MAVGERDLAAEQMEIYGAMREQERRELFSEGRLEAALDEAAFLVNEGHHDEAVAQLESLPRGVEVLAALSRALDARGDLDGAVQALAEALALDPTRLDLRVRLQDLRREAGNTP